MKAFNGIIYIYPFIIYNCGYIIYYQFIKFLECKLDS